MKHKIKNELIEVIIGLIMIITGVFLFVSKTRIESDFLSGRGTWKLWKQLLVVLPLIAGLVMMIVRPKLRVSRMIALVGVLVIAIVIFIDITVYVPKNFKAIEWVLDFVLILGGIALCIWALFIRKKKQKVN